MREPVSVQERGSPVRRPALQAVLDGIFLSARGASRVLKNGLTIVCLAFSGRIETVHVADAIRYRSLERKLN